MDSRATPMDFAALASRWDASDMAGVIEGTGDQIRFAMEDPGFPAVPDWTIDEVLVVGMGGSALPVDILNDVLAEDLRRPIGICRHYKLPAPETGRRLLVFSSFSGNTEEVVEPLESLSERESPVALITAGGRLEEIGKERGIPTILIPAMREPEGFQPRCASGYMVTYLARFLDAVGYVQTPFELFEALPDFLSGLELRPKAQEMAEALDGRMPIFYSDEHHALSLARVAKNKYNENAKRPAFFGALPEVNHNEMIGLSGAREALTVVYFRDPESHPRIQLRYDILKQVLGGGRLEFLEWSIPGSNRLERVFAALALADWISYYAALRQGIDPCGPPHRKPPGDHSLLGGPRLTPDPWSGDRANRRKHRVCQR
jgi:glucose/mannose-6-phosphate isomerase